ncbi:S41 family peptidase [Dysgonomonas sp. BGC7]|uniref:S41 family peptidase n=1 Tax=Dysgonomonas sp. BGC7 TaxID=1658008 RepID=UPI000AFEAC5E|nr:S41 family peptidase [Dysgonomonas sp. BGC7]MBD8388988.1 S41 family peptidase [Dysgonomonas sp. BGC7]
MKCRIIAYLFLSIACLSCFDEDRFENSKQGNFEALWKIIDEHYCFFNYKEVDWNDVYERYSVRISEKMDNDALFAVLGEMLAELKDGHVNLVANHDVARYWKWFEDYPDNFDTKIQKNYLGTDYSIASGLKYKILDDNTGYIYYGSFSSGIGEANINQVLDRMAVCDGIILDIRDNGGGLLTNSDKLASHFFNEKTLVGYMQHKTGKGHNDFSKPYELYVEPSKGVRYQKTVVVLINRSCYSAANDFVSAMRYAPNAILLGDKTGGGSGMPFSSELPNGWSVRFSASPMLDAEGNQIEFGIDPKPEYKIDMSEEDMAKGVDSIIEKAREIIKSEAK